VRDFTISLKALWLR